LSVISEQNAKTEFLVFLRNSDILTIAERGVTTVASETFSGTGSSQVLTLANNVVRNIRSVTVSSVAKRAYFDYTPSYSASTTTITGTFTAGTNNIVVSYDYSTSMNEKIWADYPELGLLDAGSFPRVGFDFISGATETLGLGATKYLTSRLCAVKVYDRTQNVIDRVLTSLRQAVKTSQSSLYHFGFMYPANVGPVIVRDEFDRKIRERDLDVELRFAYEQ
jgi:hypothetical protein